MVLLLVVMGAIFSLIFVVNSILRVLQAREKVSFFETLLAFLALVFPVLALVNNSASAQSLPLVNSAAMGLGVLVAVVSIITFLLERRKADRPLAQRRGVLGIGLGVLMVAATFVVPVASRLPQARLAANTAANAPIDGSNRNVADVVGTNIIVDSPTATLAKPVVVVPTNTPAVALLQMSATPTRFPSPMPTATNTPFIIATTTQDTAVDTTQSAGQSAAVQITGCTAVVRKNVNLRSGPGTDYDRLLTIPFSTTLNVSAKNKAADWWFVSYQNETGWVSGEYVNVDAGCAALPIKAS